MQENHHDNERKDEITPKETDAERAAIESAEGAAITDATITEKDVTDAADEETSPKKGGKTPKKGGKPPKKKLLIGLVSVAAAIVLAVGGFFGAQLLFPEIHVHSWHGKETLQKATCTQDGIGEFTCYCGAKTNVVPATGHKAGKKKTVRKASCFESGVQKWTCKQCKKEFTEVLPQLEHSYELQSESNVNGVRERAYTCGLCGDEFTAKTFADVKVDFDQVEPCYLLNQSRDFSFIVICAEDEAYIREHLRIIDEYFEGTEYETDEKVVQQYNVQELGNYRWRITARNGYERGNTYVAKRSGNVVFEEYGAQDLTFSIEKWASTEARLSSEVVFLQKLENESPGYYPYTKEYSEASNTLWLTLGKADGLSVGMNVCVGTAVNLSDVLHSETGENTFGKIATIEYSKQLNAYMVGLSAPDLAEIFESLDVSTSHMVPIEKVEIDEDAEALAIDALYADEDFAKFLSATYTTSNEYLEARGLSSVYGTFQEFLKSITIDKDKTQLPKVQNGAVTAKIALKGEINIPVKEANKKNAEKLGSIKITFNPYINLNALRVKIELQKESEDWENWEDVVKFHVGVTQDVTAGFSFAVKMEIDYSAEAKPYVQNTRTGVYHFATCKNVSSIKDENIKMLTAQEMIKVVAEDESGETKECDTCLPIASMKADNYVINTSTKTFHLVQCPHLKTLTSATVRVSQQSYDELIEGGYTACADCNPSSRYENSFAEALLKAISYKDFKENLDEVKKLSKNLDKATASEDIQIGADVPVNIMGFATVTFRFYVYFDFHLEANFQYEYEVNSVSSYGFRLTANGLESYSNRTEKTNKKNLSLVGKVRLDTGLRVNADVHLTGLEEFASVGLGAKVGIYASVTGAAQVDFIDGDDNYAAAYFDAGLHLEILGSAKFLIWEKENHPLLKKDFPVWRYGYEKVYYSFGEGTETITLDGLYYNLNNADLLKVNSYDLKEMKGGAETLNLLGKTGRYTVELTLESGEYCYIVNDTLFVEVGAPAFTDTLKVQVKGLDGWGRFVDGNALYTLGERRVEISYAGSDDIMQTAREFNGHYYTVHSVRVSDYLDAQRYCNAAGGYLASVSSAEENAFLAQLISETGYDSAYIGLSDTYAEGRWVWATGEAKSYENWTTEPSTETDEGDYTVLSADGAWSVADFVKNAGQKYVFVCEWGRYEAAQGTTSNSKLDALLGRYEGSYSAPQGWQGVTMYIHRTNELMKNEAALAEYAAIATWCSQENGTGKTFTATDIYLGLMKVTDEYVIVGNYYEISSNPGYDAGMTIRGLSYNEEEQSFVALFVEVIEKTDRYSNSDYRDIQLNGNELTGNLYGETFFGQWQLGYFGVIRVQAW
ncbi:MAG: C-type lectin domain-containing protein [Clostridia bacterium]|nr:C-type lectin domain-containing protein [Clostridia bacterium]